MSDDLPHWERRARNWERRRHQGISAIPPHLVENYLVAALREIDSRRTEVEFYRTNFLFAGLCRSCVHLAAEHDQDGFGACGRRDCRCDQFSPVDHREAAHQ